MLKSVLARLGNGWMLVVAILGVAVALVAIGLSWRGDVAVIPPSFASGAAPFSEQRVTPSSILRMEFPSPMDAGSIAEHMTAPEDLKGSGTWDGHTYLFDPDGDLPMGGSFTFTVSAGAKRSDGALLTKPLVYSFLVSGSPSAIARIPAPDGAEVPPDARISIIFDRPMIALAQVQGADGATFAKDVPVTIDPQIAGQWRWLGTSTLTFEADQQLDPATVYNVTVPAGLATPSGDKTDQDFSWTFSTIRPVLMRTDPEAGSKEARLLGPKSGVELIFNQEMSLPALAASITITKKGAETVAVAPLTYGNRMENGKEVQDKRVVVVKPASGWDHDADYVITVAADAKAARGTLGTPAERTIPVGTVGDFQGMSGRYEYGGVYIRFSTPLDAETIKDRIAFSPTIEDISPSVNDWDDSTELTIYPGALKPSTKYTVTIDGKAKDAFGQTIKEPFSFTFETPKLDPVATILSNGEFGIFERSKPPVFYLNGVNVSKLQVAFAPLSLDTFLDMRQGRRDMWDFKPDLESQPGYKSWTLTMQNDLNSWQHVPFDVAEKTQTGLPSGIYALSVSAPEAKDWNGNPLTEYQFFTLTNMALTLKYTGTRALVWVTDIRTGESVEGANIRIVALNGRAGASGVTDADGFFETSVDFGQFGPWDPEFFVVAEKSGDMAFAGNDWGNGIRPWDFGLTDDFWPHDGPEFRLSSFLYTDRPVYRAGDSVHFKGILRLQDRNGVMTSPRVGSIVHISVVDANGNEISAQDLRVSAFGAFDGSVDIAPEGALGYYGIYATPQDIRAYPEQASVPFSVLAYRKPEYRVDVLFDDEQYFAGDKVVGTIEGAYYFGMPMEGASVQWRAQTMDYFFNRYTDGWYTFALEDAWCWWECDRGTQMLTEGQGTLDDDGKLRFSVPVEMDDKKVSQIVSVEADVTDPNNQIVSNRASVPLHKADAYVGVRNQTWAVEPGQDAVIDIVTVKPDGSLLPNQRVDLSLYSRTWNTVRKKGVDGLYYYDNTPSDAFIRSVSAQTDGGGKASQAVRVPTGGEFRIVATVRDASGRQVQAGTSIYGWSDFYFNWPHSNSDRMEIVADKPEYKVGDTAKLLVKSPYQGKGVKALVTVEREQIMKRWVIDVAGNAQSIDVPITQDMLPNAFVSVVVVKPRTGETFDDQGHDTGLPAFKVGYAELKVDVSQRGIDLAIGTDKQQYLPGEKVDVTIETKDQAGNPVSADVSLAVVDMSILALGGFEMPDVLRMFLYNRGLGVHTANMLTFMLERFKPGSKGGGGGLETKTRGNFKDTAYWNPSVVTDAQGRATLSFTLPDDLTTWHFFAVADTKDHRFGAQAHTVVETKNVIVRPVQPRFAVHGDRMRLGAIVLNNLPEAKDFTVALSGSGFDAVGGQAGLRRSVRVEPGKQQKVEFDVTAQPVSSLTLRYLAETQGARDEVVYVIPAVPFATKQSVATSGTTDATVTEHVYPPSESEAVGVSLAASVSPTVATYLPGGLAFVTHFPYGCAEQTASSFLPNVAVAQLQGFDAFKIVSEDTLKTNIGGGLQRLYGFQRDDGGFGYWKESDRSYPYLSAYIVFAMQEAREAGYSVDQGVLDRAREYLQGVLRSGGSEPLNLAERAYVLYVLAEGGGVDRGLLENLFEKRADLPLFARAQLAMAFQKTAGNATSKRATALMEDILTHVRIDPRGSYFAETESEPYRSIMHTDTRTTAIVLQAIVRIQPDHPVLPRVVRYLLAVREDGHWDTTQSTSMSVLALVDYLKETGELDADFTATIKIAGAEALRAEFGRANNLSRATGNLLAADLQRGRDNAIEIAKAGKGTLYYDLLLSYFISAEKLPPIEQGMAVERTIAPVGNAPKDPAVGNTYKVTLTVTVPQDRHFVAVESPLPAGFEGVDLALKTAQQNLYGEEFDGSRTGDLGDTSWWWGDWDPLRYFNHREVRDDQIFLFADELPAGVYTYEYLVRATTPGTYKLRPARAYEMYFPEVFGQTAGEIVDVR